jgi:inositol 3-alpha-galactosyltransferase
VNAIKTARYWHPRLWTDAAVRNLHYIVDKPWARPREEWAQEDSVTHGWWWDRFYAWRHQCLEDGKDEPLRVCESYMLGRKGEDLPPGHDTGVGDVQSWEQSVEDEHAGKAKGYVWPPGERWAVEVDGVRW